MAQLSAVDIRHIQRADNPSTEYLMTQTLDFFFTTISPWTYLGMARLQEIGERQHAQIRYLPINLSEIFQSVEVKPLGQRPKALQANRLQELQRWSGYLSLPINLQPKHFPVDPGLSCRMLVAASTDPGVGRLAEAIMAGCWVHEQDISNPATLRAIANDCGLDGAALLGQAELPETLEQLQANTREALERGVIGSPCYLLGKQVFFGQDRLDFVERALAASA